MHQIKQTTIHFDLRLNRKQIRQFRGAVAEKAGLENLLFHNHDNRDGIKPRKYIHRYPLIQYQNQHGYASIMGLEEGAEALKTLIRNSDGQLNMNDGLHNFRIKDYQSKRVKIGITESIHYYKLHHWMPLREKHQEEWQKIDKLTDRIQFLERLLANNIIAIARALNIRFEEKFDLYLTWLADQPKTINYRNKKQLLFNLQWAGNIQLPSYIGLGKGASEGYGRLLPL